MIDTHCHIHDDNYGLDPDVVLEEARSAGVDRVICVGTDAASSKRAVAFAATRQGVWASVGLHPHDAVQKKDMEAIQMLATEESVVALGECGLDYYYDNSPRELQQAVLRRHLSIAQDVGLPLIFHIRGKEVDSSDAYDDFWSIYDEFSLPGVVHSFSAHSAQLQAALDRGLYIGINGIATFAKPGPQLDAVREIPLTRLVLETDAPLLTPVPYRGKINEPKYITTIQDFLSTLRNETTRELREQTSRNASNLFRIA